LLFASISRCSDSITCCFCVFFCVLSHVFSISRT
jgi:hypothetical protein